MIDRLINSVPYSDDVDIDGFFEKILRALSPKKGDQHYSSNPINLIRRYKPAKSIS